MDNEFVPFLNVFNILIHDVYRKNDKNCIKTLKVQKFWNFCHFFGNFSFKKTAFISSEYYWTTNSCLVERFQHSNRRCLSKKWQKCMKTVKIGKVLNFCHFRGHFWVIMGSFPSFPKKSKNLYKYISHGTKFMSVEFCECTSSYYVNNNSWQILYKKNPFDLYIFLSHMKYRRKITKRHFTLLFVNSSVGLIFETSKHYAKLP